jgi:nitrogen fixation protein NifQ
MMDVAGMEQLPWPAGGARDWSGEYRDLLALLHQHRSDDSDETLCMVQAIARACEGDNHLWEDMGLPDRDTLSRLVRRHFTTLYYKNSANMRWKKFFYRQLCDRAEARVCKAPSCGLCRDYAQCFGAE